MSRAIICIHGINNKPSKEILYIWWRTSIEEGFQREGLKIPNFKLEMVYWADLFYEKPLDPNILDPENPYYIDEPYIPAPKFSAKENHSFRKKILQYFERQLEKVFLNNDLSLNYSSVSNAVMHKYFKELESYYGLSEVNQKLKQKTRQRLLNTLKKYQYDDVMLISHSMGSIIAYDVLQFELKKQSIHTFVTLGSPLGLPFMRAKIAIEMKSFNKETKINTPDNILNAWYNFADLEDKVALNFDLKNNFPPNNRGIQPIDFEINNDYEINGKKNAHKIYGYLRSKEFILQLDSFLAEKPAYSLKYLMRTILKIGYQIRNKYS